VAVSTSASRSIPAAFESNSGRLEKLWSRFFRASSNVFRLFCSSCTSHPSPGTTLLPHLVQFPPRPQRPDLGPLALEFGVQVRHPLLIFLKPRFLDFAQIRFPL